MEQASTIIVAGGAGRRMGAALPKQFMPLGGKPLLAWPLEVFHQFAPAMQLIVVLPGDWTEEWRRLCTVHGIGVPHTVVPGGAERFHSVREGLQAVGHDGLVAVHDGVRPLATAPLVERCFAAAEKHGAAIPVLPVSSSVRQLREGRSMPVDRSTLRLVQTPQCFSAPLLRKAFNLPYDPAFTDEATLVERVGAQVHLVEGEERNIKVTTPWDLRVAEMLLAENWPG